MTGNNIGYTQAFSALCRNEGIEVRLVKRREYNEETVRWADAIISAGGMTLWKGSICFSMFSYVLLKKKIAVHEAPAHFECMHILKTNWSSNCQKI